MNILSIDTCFAACAVGVSCAEPSAFAEGLSHFTPMSRGQAEHLMPTIMDTVQAAGITLADLDLIVVNIGPGSFTGVRIGIAAARGLALGLNIPVQGVVATDALYEWSGANDARVVRIDTKRGDYYSADYTGPHDVPIDPARLSIAALGALPSAAVITDADLLSSPRAHEYPGVLAKLGARLYADTSYTLQNRADPIYVREAETSQPKSPTACLSTVS